MDRLGVKRKIYAGMADFAKAKRGESLRKKYATGSPALDAVAASQEEAADSAQMPVVTKKTMAADVSDVDSGADAAGPAMDDAMAAMAEDEEMAKWMAKQKG